MNHRFSRRDFLKFSTTAMAGTFLVACAPAVTTTAQPAATSGAPIATAKATIDTTASAVSLTFNNKAWQYDATNDVYWQIGIKYCTKPETTDYETLGIYVPGAYLTAKANGDGKYTATLNEKGTINGFTGNNCADGVSGQYACLCSPKGPDRIQLRQCIQLS